MKRVRERECIYSHGHGFPFPSLLRASFLLSTALHLLYRDKQKKEAKGELQSPQRTRDGGVGTKETKTREKTPLNAHNSIGRTGLV